VSDPAHRTLLRPGASEWKALNDEKRRLLAPPPETSVEQLLREGEALSAEAIGLLAAIEGQSDERPAGCA
jgi:hypothetical protein